MAATAAPRLLEPGATAAVLLGASDWTEAGLGRAPSFRRSAKGVLNCLIGDGGLGLDPELVLDLFDDPGSANDQLVRMQDALDALLRERRDAGRPVADLLLYYVGHGDPDDRGHLRLLVKRSRAGLAAETGIRADDLARVLGRAAPQQRRLVVLDCCFAESAVRAFVGMSGALDHAVAATAARDIAEALPNRGGLLLCSSPVGEISVGAPDAERTLFTGAVLDVLRDGAEGRPPLLSFAELRDAAYIRMVETFGSRAPRPALHPVSQAEGDLSRLPAFPNRAVAKVEEAPPATPVRGRAKEGRHDPPPKKPLGGVRRALVRPMLVAPVALVPFIPMTTAPPDPNPALGAVCQPTPTAAAKLFTCGEAREAAGNLPEAARLFLLAADQRYAPAQARLGFFHAQGWGGLGRDEREAARLYRLAAEQGNAAAQAELGFFHAQGRGGLDKDEREAARLYRLAAEQGHAWAQAQLGLFYEQGLGGLARSEREAARLYRPAADQGDASAQARLGLFYEQGLGGLAGSEREAARLYHLAAEQGDAGAQARLGLFYAEGRGGLPRDMSEAVRLYQQAARTGDAWAQQQLTRLGRRW